MPATTLETIYLDHAATTPMRAEAIEAVAEGMRHWANASSPHAAGRRARAMLEDARRRVARSLDWDGDVIITSGASEAIAIALGRSPDRRLLVSAVEHAAVSRVAGAAPRIAVDSDGMVQADELASLLAHPADFPLITVQTANSETGVLQNYDEIIRLARLTKARTVADASQTAGKLPLPDADLIVVAAHKFGGPPGVGALLVRDLADLSPTGGQEQGYRGGTENLPGALGMAAALEADRSWFDVIAGLRAKLDEIVTASGGAVIAAAANRIPTIASYRMPGVSAAAQLIRFDLARIAISAGSACSSGSLKTSATLSAMGIAPAEAGEVVRVSLGWNSSMSDVHRFAETWTRNARRQAA